jgi:4-cresol dehydrogenase (hydroxylating) flavoprotein subunit
MQDLLQELSALLGSENVTAGDAAQAAGGICTSGVQRSIRAVVFPGDTEQVVSVVKRARAHGAPVYPVSTGKNWGYGTSQPAIDGCLVINLSRMKRVVTPLDPVTGLITIEPGVTQGDLGAYLDRENLPFLVPTTGAGPSVSVVGNALERGHGISPIADHFSAVTGIEAVLADGSIYRSPMFAAGATRGGQGFRWGIGPYLDGLFTQGAFGVVTKVTLALAPRPESIKVFVCWVRATESLEAVVLAVQRILTSLPGVVGGINVMNAQRVLAMAVPYPHEAVGPAGVIPQALLQQTMGKHHLAPWTVFGTLYGTKRMVSAARAEIRALLAPHASRLKFISPEIARLLNKVAQRVPVVRERVGPSLRTLDSSMTVIAGRPNQTALPLAYWKLKRPAPQDVALDPARDGCGLLWYVPCVEVKPQSTRDFVDLVRSIMIPFGFEPIITLISVSERCFLGTIPVLFDAQIEKERAAAMQCYRALLQAGASRGFFPYRIDVHVMDWLMTQAPDYWRTVAKLKHALDPQGIISPGRYAPIPRET